MVFYTVAAAYTAWHTGIFKKEAFIAEWHRYNMYIATDPRVDILGHPWWFDKLAFATWYFDINVIPVSMQCMTNWLLL